MAGAYLEEHELAAQGGLIHVHERGQLGQRYGGVQLQQLLEAGQMLLLLHHALEAPQLQPVCFLHQHRTLHVDCAREHSLGLSGPATPALPMGSTAATVSTPSAPSTQAV